MSERRHRVHGHELPVVMKAIKDLLSRLVESRIDLPEAETLFKVLYRFESNKWGRPIYPEPVTWGLIEDYLGKGPFILPYPTEAPTIKEGS